MAKNQRRQSDPGDPLFSLEDYPFYLMTRTMAEYYGLLEKALQAVGVDQPRWRVLMILGAQTPSTMTELSRRSTIKNSTMTRLIQRMEREGLVRSTPQRGDNRVSEVTLTKTGEARLAMVKAVGSRLFNQAFGNASPEDQSRFVTMLKAVFANLTRSPYEAPPQSSGRHKRKHA